MKSNKISIETGALAIFFLYLSIYFLEVLIFSDIILITPKHLISFDSWSYFIHDWVEPEYWSNHSELILGIITAINSVAFFLLIICFLHIGKNANKYDTTVKICIISYLSLVILDLLLAWSIRHYADFYRIYMLGNFPAMLSCFIPFTLVRSQKITRQFQRKL